MESPLQELKEKSVVTVEDLPLANNALRRRFEMFLARHRIELTSVKRIPAGFLVGPILDPAIKSRMLPYRAKGQHCHLVDIATLDQYGSCLAITDTNLCENRHLEDY